MFEVKFEVKFVRKVITSVSIDAVLKQLYITVYRTYNPRYAGVIPTYETRRPDGQAIGRLTSTGGWNNGSEIVFVTPATTSTMLSG